MNIRYLWHGSTIGIVAGIMMLSPHLKPGTTPVFGDIIRITTRRIAESANMGDENVPGVLLYVSPRPCYSSTVGV